GGIGAITCSQAAADLTDPESPVLAKPVMTVFVDVPLTTESAGTYGSDTQKDIMIASIEGQAPLTSGSAALTFKHALSQLVFKGVIDHETTIHKAVVKSIKLVNVASDGTITYTAATDAFSAAINDGIGAAGQTKEYAANIVNNTVTKLDNNTEGPESSVLADYISGQADNADGRNYQLMILPQTSVACTGVTNAVNVSQKTAPTAGTYFLVNADLYANNNNVDKVISSTTNVYIPLAETTWAPGTKYTYTFKFGDNLMHPITFTAAISDWTDAAKNVEY
ncbi:MAG: fimbrillin family protein, partial [Prevotella sp.]|nr:fimbrillin family protein [Prevotella sp.]